MYNIEYRKKYLKRCFEDNKFAQKKLGKKLARSYVEKVNILKAIESLYDLRNFTFLRFHSLKGKYRGRYSVDLDEKNRLHFSEAGDRLNILMMEEIHKNHYGD